MINVWLGYDLQFIDNIPKLVESICRHTEDVKINFLIKDKIKSLTRQNDKDQSTDSAYTRWMVPFLADYTGWHLYIDSDTLICDDIKKLWNLRDDSKSVMVVKHNAKHNQGVKFNGHYQSDYERKNWSSVMLFNAERCKILSPELINNTGSGLYLHQFKWLDDSLIGELPNRWNHLVGIDKPNPYPGIIHWTLGGPWFDKFSNVEHAEKWKEL